MKKLLLVSLALMITFSLTGRTMSSNGLQIGRAIAMEQKSEGVNMLKPPQPPAEVFPDVAPNDPYYTQQWSLDDYGEVYKVKNKIVATSNHGIQAQKAWKLGYSGENVKIAMLGYGIAYKDVDIDGDGDLDFGKAPDFVNTNFDNDNAIDFTVYNGDIVADLTAGTVDINKFGKNPVGVADVTTINTSIVAASTNNSLGIAGISYGATILPIKVFSYTGDPTFSGIPSAFIRLQYAINYAVAKGADIIYLTNMQTTIDNDDFHGAIQNAYNQGIVFICSSWASESLYPQAYDEVISVGVANFDGVPTYQSMSGGYLDLIAPGGNVGEDKNKDNYNDGILGFCESSNNPPAFTYSRTDYHGVGGAHVVGVVALMLDKNPNLTPNQVRSILIDSAKEDAGITYPNNTYGYGLVDAYGALVATPAP